MTVSFSTGPTFLSGIDILNLYERASKQVLKNKDKTSIFFNRITSQEVKTTIVSIAGVRAMGHFEKYLGFSTAIGKNNCVAFHGLIDRTWSRISNWKAKFLSTAGKEILVKAILQVILTYTMGILLFLNPSV